MKIDVNDILEELDKEYNELIGFEEEYILERKRVIKEVYYEIVKIRSKLRDKLRT